MTATKAPAAQVMSGWCGSGGHGRCRGAYAGCVCPCTCHTEPAEPEPEVLGEIAAALTELGTAAVVELATARHCPTCTCGGAA